MNVATVYFDSWIQTESLSCSRMPPQKNIPVIQQEIFIAGSNQIVVISVDHEDEGSN
jgi:hypothetical protein